MESILILGVGATRSIHHAWNKVVSEEVITINSIADPWIPQRQIIPISLCDSRIYLTVRGRGESNNGGFVHLSQRSRLLWPVYSVLRPTQILSQGRQQLQLNSVVVSQRRFAYSPRLLEQRLPRRCYHGRLRQGYFHFFPRYNWFNFEKK